MSAWSLIMDLGLDKGCQRNVCLAQLLRQKEYVTLKPMSYENNNEINADAAGSGWNADFCFVQQEG